MFQRKKWRPPIPLHRWIKQVLGLIDITSALPYTDESVENDDNNNNTNNQSSAPNHSVTNADSHSNSKCPPKMVCLQPSHDDEIRETRKDSEEIFAITRFLVNAYPQASTLVDNWGKTPLEIALQWEPNSLIRYQSHRRSRRRQKQRQLHLEHQQQQQQHQQQESQFDKKHKSNNETVDDESDNVHTQRLIKEFEYRIQGIVKIMVEAYPPAAQVTCSFGCTPLHYAIEKFRSMRTIRILLDAYPEATQICNDIGELPLHTAASMAAPLNLLDLILNAGPTAAIKEDRGGRTALHWIWIRYIIAATSSPSSSSATTSSAFVKKKINL